MATNTPREAIATALDRDHEDNGFTLGYVEKNEHLRMAELAIRALTAAGYKLVEA